jgi:hypothetical protein
MVEASLLVADHRYQEFYKRASRTMVGSNTDATVVLVSGLGMEAGDTCTSNAFSIFDKSNRGHRALRRVLDLGFGRRSSERDAWNFSATYFDAYGEYAPVHDDDTVEYFGGVINGRMRRHGNAWEAWVQHP